MRKKSHKKHTKIKKKNSSFQRRKWRWFLWLGVVIFIFVVLGMGVAFYFNLIGGKLINSIYGYLPLPIVKVNTAYITSAQLIEDTRAVQKFYQSKDYAQKKLRVDFSTDQGKMRLQIKEKDILNKLIENAMVRELARQKGILLSGAEVDRAVEDSLKKAEGSYKQLELNLKMSYGWSIDDFKNKIVRNQLYLEKLFKWYESTIKNTATYKKAEEIKEKLKDGGSDFNDLVLKFSEAESARQEGKIDWMRESQIIPEVVKEIKKMKPGQISPVIISPLGLHIVKLEDRKKINSAQNASEEEFQLRQIFLRGTSFVDWLQTEKKKIPVKVFWKKYQWDRNRGEVIFSRDDMKRMEKSIRIKSQGDPSL